MKPLVSFESGETAKQCRIVPLKRNGKIDGIIMAHSNCASIDPQARHIRWPDDTLKIDAYTLDGERLWRKDLGPGIVPGLWFCPVFPFDLDGDGDDEIYLVTNSNPDFPFDCHAMVLEGLSASTGEIVRSRPWHKVNSNQGLQMIFRFFIQAGFSKGERRIITAQGTYDCWTMQGYDAELNLLWERQKLIDDPGPCGSHMFPVLDIDGDGRDEIFFGERCTDIDTGQDKWMCDPEGWWGHSDIVMPTLDRKSGRWMIYTCRELPQPREARGIVMFDDQGRELWGYRNMEHVHTGWTARLCDDGTHRCFAVEMSGNKTGVLATHFFDIDGNRLEQPFSLQGARSVDFNGDGMHELVYGRIGYGRNFKPGEVQDPPPGVILDRHGKEVGRIEGGASCACKLLDHPGEQILTRDNEGVIRIYGCPDAKDTDAAKSRYEHPYYDSCRRLYAVGYNWNNLGGL